jgi:hypothetical protein
MPISCVLSLLHETSTHSEVLVKLSDHIATFNMQTTRRCKVCDIIQKLPEEERLDVFKAFEDGVSREQIKYGLNARLKELGINDSVGVTTLRIHLLESHDYETIIKREGR